MAYGVTVKLSLPLPETTETATTVHVPLFRLALLGYEDMSDPRALPLLVI
jgi:hypothetical protein